MRSFGQQLEADLGDHPVFADQRHHIRQRPDRRHLDETRQPVVAAGFAAQRLHQFQRDADACQVLVRIAAVVPLGVDHRQRQRQLAVGLVVIGDDQIDAEFAGAKRRIGAADAAVHRHDQRDAIGVQPFDRGRLQPIAVLQSLRDEVRDVGAEQLERAAQDDGGRNAIDIVVAVDRDPFLACDRGHDPIDRDAHIGKAHRIVQMIERRIQEPARLFRIGEAALAQQSRDDRRYDRAPPPGVRSPGRHRRARPSGDQLSASSGAPIA